MGEVAADPQTLTRRLRQLARDSTLHPEHRLFARALASGDPDAVAALERADGPLAQHLARLLRCPPRLRVVPAAS
jgi:hypothetical protein